MALDPTLTMVATEFRNELQRQLTPFFQQFRAGPSVASVGSSLGIPEPLIASIQSYMSQMLSTVGPLAIQLRTMANPNTAASTMFTTIMPEMAQGMIERVTRQVDMATQGAQLGVGGFDLDRAARYDALRMDQEARLRQLGMDHSRTLISGMGPTMPERETAMTSIAQMAADTPAIQRLKGLTTDWGDRIMDVIELMSSHVDVLSMSKDQQARFAQEVGVSAMQLYELSVVTGKSAHDITQRSRQAIADPNIQMALNLLQGTEKEKFQSMYKGLEQQFGVQVANLLLPVVVNSRPTAQQRALMAAMGPAFGNLVEAARLQMASAKDPSLRRAADAAMITAQAAMQRQTQSPEFNKMGLQTARQDIAEAVREIITHSDMRKPLQSTLDELRRSNPAATEADAIKALQTRASRAAGGLVLDGEQAGTPDPTKYLGTRIMRASDDFATLAAAGTRTMADVTQGLMHMDGAVDKVTKAFNALHEFLLGPARTADAGAAESQRRMGELLQPVVEYFRQSSAATPTTPPPVHRKGGSLDATGKYIEDFGRGTPAVLHDKEGVITESQLEHLVSSAVDSGKRDQPAVTVHSTPPVAPPIPVDPTAQERHQTMLSAIPSLADISKLIPTGAIPEAQYVQLISSLLEIKSELSKDDQFSEKLEKILYPLFDATKKDKGITEKDLTNLITTTLALDKPTHTEPGITEKELTQAISSVLELGKVAPTEVSPEAYKGLFGDFDTTTKELSDAHIELSKKVSSKEETKVPTALTMADFDPSITEILTTLKRMTNLMEQVVKNSTDIKDSNNRMVKSTSKMLGSR